MLKIEVLLTEAQLAEEFAAAFEARNLPEKFFYWFPLSVKAWLDLCKDGAYQNFIRSKSTLEEHACQLAEAVPPGELEVASLGAGQGTKDLLLLEAVRHRGARLTYRPVDTSQALLEMACGAAAGAGFACTGLKADLNDPLHLEWLRENSPPAPRLYLLLGNTLGAFDPVASLARLRKLLRERDHLLVDGEIFSGTQTLAGYDNPVNRIFAFGPLASIGIGEEDGELRFETRSDTSHPGLHLIAKHFLPARDLELHVAGYRVRLDAGQRLEMNFSYKYSREAFLELLESAGLEIQQAHESNDGRFLTVLASPQGSPDHLTDPSQ